MSSAQEPSSRPGFWEQRTGWTLLKQALFLEPLPGGARWAAAFGSLLLVAFAIQVLTGILLTMNYAPSLDSAWPSVKFIQEEVPLGAFIRALHHWGSSAMVILLLVHLVQVFVWGAYKKPRELTWMVGVVLLVCTLGLAFTGYLLPWDQKAYWATKVGLGIVSTTPVVGDSLRALLQGGPEMGNLTLTRFFTIHAFLLPGLLIVLVVVHLYLFRLHGVTPPWWLSPEQLKAVEEPFWPRQLLKDGVVWLIFLLALGFWCFSHPAPLEAQADPSQPYEARPEWYFMFLFQLLRYFHGPYEVVGTFWLPLGFFLMLFFWPFLDRNPQRAPSRRPVALGLLTAGCAGLIGLTIFAIRTDVRMTEPAQVAAQAPKPVEPAGPIQRADVAKVYNDQCAACHGVDGSGKAMRAGLPTIPDFTSLAWQLSQTDLEITHRIQDGNEPLMPAYRNKVTPTQVLALTVYVRAFAIGPAETPALKPPPVVAAQMPSVQVYRAYCLACHDADGSGKVARKAMPDLPDFTDPKWQTSRTDAELKQSILEGRRIEGKPQFMLPMKDKLSPDDAEHMVAFVRSFQADHGLPPFAAGTVGLIGAPLGQGPLLTGSALFPGRSECKQVIPVEPPPVVPPPPTEPTVVPHPKGTPAPTETTARMRAATGLYRQYCLICHGSDGKGREMKASMPTLPDFASRSWQEGVSNPRLAASILDGKGTLMPAFRGRVSEDQARDLAAYVRAFGPARPAAPEAPADDFEKRFRELQDQWNELDRQLKELSKPPRKP
jgi:ubiquinol-cytochrome c reductase cytochrome b subunit